MTDATPGEPGSAEANGSGGNKKRHRRRRSKWSSGVIKRPKHPAKKKIITRNGFFYDEMKDVLFF